MAGRALALAACAAAVLAAFAGGLRERGNAVPARATAEHAAPQRDVRLGPTPAAARIRFSLVLRQRQAELDRFLEDLYDPSSSQFRQFLTPATFGKRFGPTLAAIADVRRRVEAAGLDVTSSYPQRTSLGVEGRAGDVTRFFGVALADFRDESGRRYHRPLRVPRIPSALRPTVTAVAGLDAQPFAKAPRAAPLGGLKPRDAALAYNVEPLWERGLRGEGQTVAVISFASFNPQDIAGFDQATGITGATEIERVPVNGGSDDTQSETTGEVTLDLETIRGIAPRARILNYETDINRYEKNPGTQTLTSLIAATAGIVNQIVADRRADIASISYGICDVATTQNGQPHLDPADRQAAEDAFRAAAAAGITIYSASGDQGAFECQRFDETDLRITAGWPASPWVVSVGGTLLAVRQNGTYFDEAGWEDVLTNAGTGGGLNPKEPRPEWQRGPGVENEHSNGKRQIPDVAAAADPDSGWFVFWRGEGVSFGGTSASAPFWAAVTVLVRQLAEQEKVGANGFGRLGYLNPVLYELARTQSPPPFHDVTRGGNRFYNATPGWDFATGLGSPDARLLADQIVAYLRER